jgi:hypothetical protein
MQKISSQAFCPYSLLSRRLRTSVKPFTAHRNTPSKDELAFVTLPPSNSQFLKGLPASSRPGQLSIVAALFESNVAHHTQSLGRGFATLAASPHRPARIGLHEVVHRVSALDVCDLGTSALAWRSSVNTQTFIPNCVRTPGRGKIRKQ